MPKKDAPRDGVYDRGAKGFWISYTDEYGKRRQQYGGSTITQARETREERRTDVRKAREAASNGSPLPTEETFGTIAKRYLKYQTKRCAAAELSGPELERQRGIIEGHLIPFFGALKLKAVRRSKLIAYIESRTGEVAAGTIIKEANVLKHLFSLATDEWEIIPKNPARRLKLPQAPEGRTRFLTPDQWLAVFRACYIEPTDEDPEPEQWLQWAAGLAVSLGTRRGELMHTTVPDVDLDARRVTLRVTKNGRTRGVFINDLAMQVFEVMGLRDRKRHKDRRVLFPKVTPEQLSMRFIRACRDAGVEDFSLHDLRHTFASHLRMKGADLDDIRRLLGHSDLRMTIRYSHLLPGHLEAAASRLDGVLTLPAPRSEPAEESEGDHQAR